MITISLLHATYRSGPAALKVREQWLTKASHPDLVEHVFGLGSDDHASLAATCGHQRVIGEPSAHVTAVRNWNLAAGAAGGDILVVIADDLVPSGHGWDEHLREIGSVLDPLRFAYAIKLSDSPNPADTLMRHPVVSRRFFQTYGLFHDGFTGVFCDDDITLTAFWKAVIIDGRHIVLDHIHPAIDPSIRSSESQERINSQSEYQRGRIVLARRWPAWKRGCKVRLLSISTDGARIGTGRFIAVSVLHRLRSALVGVPVWGAAKVIGASRRYVRAFE